MVNSTYIELDLGYMSQTDPTLETLFLEVNDYWLKQIVTADGWNLGTSLMQFMDQVRFLKIPSPIGFMYGISTYIYHKNQPNVGKYTSPMDPMGVGISSINNIIIMTYSKSTGWHLKKSVRGGTLGRQD